MEADVGPRITGLEHKTEELRKAIVERNEQISNHRDGNQNVTNLRLEGASSWHLTLCLLLTAVSVLVAGFAMYTASDAKGELRAQRIEQAIMNNWTSQEVTAIRSYITNGKLAPMKPRPMDSNQQEKP